MSAPAPMIAAAAYVASRLGPGPGSRGVRDAIIAWWAAEEGYRWPPNSLNNPGFMRPPGQEQFGTATGTVSGAPGVFKRFADAGHGVDAFIDRVATSAHYPGIRAAIRAVASGSANAVTIANAVGASPWGTNGATMRTALAYVQRTVGATPSVAWRGAGSGNADPAVDDINAGGPAAVAQVLALLQRLGISTDRAHVITHDEAGRIADAVVADPSIPIRGIIENKTVGQLLDAANAGKYLPGSGPIGDINAAVAGVGDAIAGLPGAIGEVLRELAVLVAILGVIMLGLYTLVRTGEEAPA